MTFELGPQPLDEVMKRLGLTNENVVSASTEQLSFKMLQKGRKGRRLTPNVQKKILNAVRSASAARAGSDRPSDQKDPLPSAPVVLTIKDLFNY
jgi:hypothetical protein